MLAAILAWLLPRREKLVAYAAIIGVGLIFGLAKTVPAFHALTINVLELLTGWPNVLRMDPTDLIALSALLLAWWIWKQSATQSIRLPNRGWVLVPLAVLATMANSPAPNSGIACLEMSDSSRIIARDAYTAYASDDGGFTWSGLPDYGPTGSCRSSVYEARQIFDPNRHVQYRFIGDTSIEQSIDGGQTWQTDFVLHAPTESETALQQRHQYNFYRVPSPIAALIHQPTGNLVLAMGFDGVLLRTPDGTWHWAPVGLYHLPDFRRIDNVISLLAGELLYALALIALMIGTLARRVSTDFWRLTMLAGLFLGWGVLVLALGIRAVYVVLLLLPLVALGGAIILSPGRFRVSALLRLALKITAWLGWLTAVLVFPPAISTGYANGISVLAAITVAIFAVPMAVGQVRDLWQLGSFVLLRVVVIAIIGAGLFMLPYILWSQDTIPFYNTATLYALALVAASVFAGNRYVQHFILQLPPEVLAQRNTRHASSTPRAVQPAERLGHLSLFAGAVLAVIMIAFRFFLGMASQEVGLIMLFAVGLIVFGVVLARIGKGSATK